MENGDIVKLTIQALLSLHDESYFSDERVYQGGLLCQLNFLWNQQKWPNDKIKIQQERQKNIPAHGIRLRPDIIMHIPTLRGQPIHKGNFAVYAIKRNASKKEALSDFEKLDEMFTLLKYPLGIFINIGSDKTYLDAYDGKFQERIHAFSVQIFDEEIIIHHEYRYGLEIEENVIRQNI